MPAHIPLPVVALAMTLAPLVASTIFCGNP
jgi:hypothetical protein